MNKIIAELSGGLGNQLFIYATARRLAIVNKARLFLDAESGFINDIVYKRTYKLFYFDLPAQYIKPIKGNILYRINKLFFKYIGKFIPFRFRKVLSDKNGGFKKEMITYNVSGKVVIEGYWQSYKYFIDIKDILFRDLHINSDMFHYSLALLTLLKDINAVVVHIRFFDPPDTKNSKRNLPYNYYEKAFDFFGSILPNPIFYVFTEYPRAAKDFLKSKNANFYFNDPSDNEVVDFYLMTQCKNIIISNSTFSWWAAWLSTVSDNKVVCPNPNWVVDGSWNQEHICPNWYCM